MDRKTPKKRRKRNKRSARGGGPRQPASARVSSSTQSTPVKRKGGGGKSGGGAKKKQNGGPPLVPFSLESVADEYERIEMDPDEFYARQKELYSRKYASDDNDASLPVLDRHRSNSVSNLEFTTRVESKQDLMASMYDDPSLAHISGVLRSIKESKSNRLELSKHAVSVDMVDIIADFIYNVKTPLTCVDLSHGTLDGPSVGKLVTAITNAGVQLQEFSVAHNHIGSLGADFTQDLVERSMHLRVLNMANTGIGDTGCVSIAHGLVNHASIEILNLENNNITPVGARALAAALGSNSSLHVLHVGQNPLMGDKGVCAIIRALNRNSNVLEVGLWDTGVGYKGAVQLAELMNANSTLQCLRIEANSLGEDGCCVVATALRLNCSLRELSMGLNGLVSGGEAILLLADALRYNQFLSKFTLNGSGIDVADFHNPNAVSLDLSGRNLEAEDVIIVAAMLLDNTSVLELDLRYNTVGQKGAIALVETLKVNDTLEILWVNDRLPVKELKECMRNNSSPQQLEQLLAYSRFGYEEVMIVSALADYYDVMLPSKLSCFNPQDIQRVDSSYAVLEALVANPGLSIITHGVDSMSNKAKLKFKHLKHRARPYVVCGMLIVCALQQIGFLSSTWDSNDNDDEQWRSYLNDVLEWSHVRHMSLSHEVRFFVTLGLVAPLLIAFLPVYISLIPTAHNSNKGGYVSHTDRARTTVDDGDVDNDGNQRDGSNSNDTHNEKRTRVRRTLTIALTPAYLTRPPSVNIDRRSSRSPWYAFDVLAHRLYSRNSTLFFCLFLHCFLCTTVFVIPVVRTLTDVFQCYHDDLLGYEVLRSDADFRCWSTSHYVMFYTSAVLLPLYFVLVLRLARVGGAIDGTFYAPSARGFSWVVWSRDIGDTENRSKFSAHSYSWLVWQVIVSVLACAVTSPLSEDAFGTLTTIVGVTCLCSCTLLFTILTLPFYRGGINRFMLCLCICVVYAFVGSCLLLLVTMNNSENDWVTLGVWAGVPLCFIVANTCIAKGPFELARETTVAQVGSANSAQPTLPSPSRRYRRQLSLSEKVERVLRKRNKMSREFTFESPTANQDVSKQHIAGLKDLRKRAELELKRVGPQPEDLSMSTFSNSKM